MLYKHCVIRTALYPSQEKNGCQGTIEVPLWSYRLICPNAKDQLTIFS